MERKKILLLVAKAVLAAGLLAWVLSKTHWRDYVVTDQGRTYSVIRAVGPEAPWGRRSPGG